MSKLILIDVILLKSILALFEPSNRMVQMTQAGNDRRGLEGERKGGQLVVPWRRLPRQFPTNCNF